MSIELLTKDFTVQKGNSILIFKLTRKKVKHINIRVKSDGSINVSANYITEQKEIDNFLLSKIDYLLKIQANFKRSIQLCIEPKQYINGESFYILGKHCRLKVIESSNETVIINGLYLVLSIKDTENYRRKHKMIKEFLALQCRELFQEISSNIYKVFKKYGINKPKIKIRDMKIRWGSCFPQKGILVLNNGLLEVPRNCIEYIILHEYCHFIYPNHSKDFYTLVSILMPDWKERKKQLELTQKYCSYNG